MKPFFKCHSWHSTEGRRGGGSILGCQYSCRSLIADGPHHYHPACGHQGSSHLSLVHALRFFIAMQVQHSYNSPTNGYLPCLIKSPLPRHPPLHPHPALDNKPTHPMMCIKHCIGGVFFYSRINIKVVRINGVFRTDNPAYCRYCR